MLVHKIGGQGCLSRHMVNKCWVIYLQSVRRFSVVPKEATTFANKHRERSNVYDEKHRLPFCCLHRSYNTTRTQHFMHKDDYLRPSEKKNTQDFIPKGYDLIYESDEFSGSLIVNMIIWIVVRVVIGAFVIGGVFICGCYLYGRDVAKEVREWKEWLFGFKLSTIIAGFAGALSVLLLSQLFRLRSRLIHRMYYDRASDTCIAVLPKGLFQKQQLTFRPDEAFGLQKTGRKGNFVINGRYCHVYERNFAKFGSVRFFNKWFT